jgi:hypothetical protein
VSPREAGECEEVFAGVVEHDRDLRVRPLEHLGDLVELAADVFPVGLGEDRAADPRLVQLARLPTGEIVYARDRLNRRTGLQQGFADC